MDMKKIEAAFANLRAVFDSLCDDVVECRALAENISKPSLRRAYVRAVFAMIEGVTFQVKQVCLIGAVAAEVELSPEEKSLLADETYELTQQGQPQVRTKFIPIESNFRFAMTMMGRVLGVDFGVDVNGVGWANFKKALIVRNRITHPKSLAECEISDADFQTVVGASDWFVGAFAGLGGAVTRDGVVRFIMKPQ